MARTRKSALDSVLDEIQEQAKPSLQEMLKAKAEAEKEEADEMERLKEGENPAEDIPIAASEEQLQYDPEKPAENIGEIMLMDSGAMIQNFENAYGATEFRELSPEASEKVMAMFPGVFKPKGDDVEGDAPVPDIVETEVAVVEEPVKAVTIEEQYQDLKLTQREKDMVLDGRLREILGVPKSRTAVPTLVRYRQDGQLALRGVIIDIGEYELTEGWKLYKSQVDDATPEKYLLKVYELTQTEIPRMYRTVGEMRLE